MSAKKPGQGRNEELIRCRHYLAEAASKDKPEFETHFAEATATSNREHHV
jgi:hypothetical protein